MKKIYLFFALAIFLFSVECRAMLYAGEEDPSKVHRITQSDFNSHVDAFRGKLTRTSPRRKELKEFLKTPGISAYLTRLYKAENFDEFGPIDCSEQELWLYETLDIDYRSHIAEKRFFIHGTPSLVEECYVDEFNRDYPNAFTMPSFHLNDIRRVIDGLQLHLPFDDIRVEPADLECKPNETYYNALQSRRPRFFITLCNASVGSGMRHATIVFHIMNAERTYVQASFMINSFSEEVSFAWFRALKPTFSHSSQCNGCADCEKIYRGDYNSDFLPDVDSLNDIAKFKGLTFNAIAFTNEGAYRAKVTRKTPLTYIALGIQIEEDKNCGLFSLNITNALLKMTQKDVYAERLCSLAQQVEERNFKAPNEIQEISHTLTEGLKEFLPQYYDAGREEFPKRSQIELDEFHRQQRWEASSRSIVALLQ